MINCAFENGNKASLRHAVVDALVLEDGKILLAKRANKLLEGGKWGIIGGFVDRDENLKEAIAREILEETGYKVKDITLLTIIDNPNRPKEDRQNIAFVYFCHAVEKVGDSDDEVADQQWFDFTNLPPEDQIAFDHYQSIQLYLEYKNKNLSLPVLT